MALGEKIGVNIRRIGGQTVSWSRYTFTDRVSREAKATDSDRLFVSLSVRPFVSTLSFEPTDL